MKKVDHYDGYTPSKDVSGLPGGKHAQWQNLARTHAEFEREYYSLRAIIKRNISLECDWRAVAGIIVLLVIFAGYHLAM